MPIVKEEGMPTPFSGKSFPLNNGPEFLLLCMLVQWTRSETCPPPGSVRGPETTVVKMTQLLPQGQRGQSDSDGRN